MKLSQKLSELAKQIEYGPLAVALVRYAKESQVLETKAERWDWSIALISGDDTPIANMRALALGGYLLAGHKVEEAVDLAIDKEKVLTQNKGKDI